MENAAITVPNPPARRARWPWFLLAGALLITLAVLAFHFVPIWLNPPDPGPDLSPQALDARLLDNEAAMGAIKRGQSGLDQRLTDTRARTDLLRDEVLAVGQRSAIIEDNLRELAEATRQSRDVLRLDEAELLLGLAQTRLTVASDLKGAINATALAEAALAALSDPQWVNLRQTLAEELAALRHLPADPRLRARDELSKVEAALPSLQITPDSPAAPIQATAGWQRLLDALVQIRPSGSQDLLAPSERSAGEAALALELALARMALEDRDDARFAASLGRIERWLVRLYAQSPALNKTKARLAALAAESLSADWPALGRTLAQLRDLRRPSRRLP